MSRGGRRRSVGGCCGAHLVERYRSRIAPERTGGPMCRNIRPLFNFEPEASDAEIRASALQYVRKVSGYTKPSRANEEAFDRAVEEVSAVTRRLLEALVTDAPPKDREVEAARARVRAERRYGAA
jgi:hypothetical protein